MKVAGKVALITGGATGLGRATGLALARLLLRAGLRRVVAGVRGGVAHELPITDSQRGPRRRLYAEDLRRDRSLQHEIEIRLRPSEPFEERRRMAMRGGDDDFDFWQARRALERHSSGRRVVSLDTGTPASGDKPRLDTGSVGHDSCFCADPN